MALSPQERSRRMRLNMLMGMSYATFASTKGAFTPADLFAAGEQGAWYDPSDFSTMFQDAAGTTPVTAVEQPVGLILDKSLRLSLGPELATAPDLSWDGTAATNTAVIGPVVSGRWYIVSWTGLSTSAVNTVNLRVGVTSVTPNVNVASSTAPNYSAYFLAPSTGNVQVYASGPNAASVGSYTSVSLKEIAGNHAYQTTSTSRPVLRQEADGRYYLAFDGTDDFLVTGTINPGSVDKVQVFAGVRKLSDAAAAVVAELSTTSSSSDGSFGVFAPLGAASPAYTFRSRGTALVTATTGANYASPNTSVLAGLADISGDNAVLRVNAVQAAQSTGDQGTGNFGSHALYVGRRAGSTTPYNGRLYGLIVRFSAANLSSETITKAETWMNTKTGAY